MRFGQRTSLTFLTPCIRVLNLYLKGNVLQTIISWQPISQVHRETSTLLWTRSYAMLQSRMYKERGESAGWRQRWRGWVLLEGGKKAQLCRGRVLFSGSCWSRAHTPMPPWLTALISVRECIHGEKKGVCLRKVATALLHFLCLTISVLHVWLARDGHLTDDRIQKRGRT